MSDGRTKVEEAEERLRRAAIRYSEVGRRKPSEEGIRLFKRTERALGSAAINYAATVSRHSTK